MTGAAATRSTASARLDDPVGEPTVGILESGSTQYVDGTFAWTGYAYNDHGPNTSAGQPGAATYPDAVDQSNAANLIQFQAALDRHGGLRLRGVLETLTHPDLPLMGIGLDTDNRTSTGAPTVPGGEWQTDGALGLDYFITVSASGARLLRWDGHGWAVVRRLPARVSSADNTMSTVVPTSALPLRRTLSAVAVLGLRRPGASWLAGHGPIYDLGFVRAEPPTTSTGMLSSAETVAATHSGHATGGEWQDIRQADVLTGHRAASAAVARINLAAMRDGRTIRPRLETPGYHVMLYRSHVALPGGIIDGTEAGGLWAGPYQPYLVELPPHPTGRLPVLLYLHGGGGDHLDNGIFAPEGPLRIGRSVAVFPYGREPTTAQDHGYQGVSEQDVLDVLDDARRQFRTDPRRALIVGVSTGAGGAFRLAQLHPDLFGGVLVMSGYDDTHLPENVINLPVVLQNGGADPAANQAVLDLTIQELAAFKDIGFMSYSAAAHTHADPTAPLLQCEVRRLLATPIVRNPARVVLSLDPANDPPGLPRGVRLHHGRAYWLSGVATRRHVSPSPWHTPAGDPPGYGDNAVGRIDVTSRGFARRTSVGHNVAGVGQNVTTGADFCGPSSARSNDVWWVRGRALRAGPVQPTSNSFTLTARNLRKASFNLPRMRLTPRRRLRILARGDGPIRLTLLGRWGNAPVALFDNARRVATLRPRRGRLTIRMNLSGTHRLVLTRQAAGGKTTPATAK